MFRDNLGAALAVMGCLGVFGLAQGLSYPLLALVLEARGFDEAAIGVNAAMMAAGTLATGLVLPALVRRLGQRFFAFVGLGGCVVAWLLFPLFSSYGAWLVLRFFLGAAAAATFVIGETWLNQLVEPARRGRAIGLYGVVISGCFCLGPVLLAVLGSGGWGPYLAGAVVNLAALALVAAARRRLPDRAAPLPRQGAAPGIWRLGLGLLSIVAAAALFDQAVLSLVPVHAVGQGLGEATAALMVTAMSLGNVVLQMPLGWLADRTSVTFALIFSAVAGLLLALALPGLIGASWLAWPALLLWGGFGFALYTLSLVELGHRYSDERLVAGNAAFAVVWGLGGLLGPVVIGALMSGFGADALFWALALLLGVVALAVALRRRPGLARRGA